MKTIPHGRLQRIKYFNQFALPIVHLDKYALPFMLPAPAFLCYPVLLCYNPIMNRKIQTSMNKQVIRIEEPGRRVTDYEYWSKRPYGERLNCIEFLREQFYGSNPATERFQRVLEIADR